MSNCPFLSNHLSEVPCFQECVFYEYTGMNGLCPFRAHIKDKVLEIGSFYEYDLLRNEGAQLLEDLYEDNSYYRIFKMKSIV